MGTDIVLRTDLQLPLFIAGKVRDTYILDRGHLLIVATDRISAFDVVLASGIPYKGEVLNRLSAFWFKKVASILPHHMVAVVQGPDELYPFLPQGSLIPLPEYLARRSMVVRRAQRIPVECIVRGYLTGSAWAEYSREGVVCGHVLPPGLVESEALPEPIFTPTTKAETGHDVPLSAHDLQRLVGKKLAQEMERMSLALYDLGQDYALSRGFIIADTKFEFGLAEGKLMLIDELLTPDSSRFWDIEHYQPGRAQDSFDKQIVRNWLESWGWDKKPPGPALPQDIVTETSNRYWEVFRRLTGEEVG